MFDVVEIYQMCAVVELDKNVGSRNSVIFFFMKLKMYKIQGKLNFRNNHILKFKEK
jgi:hypothetical protein